MMSSPLEIYFIKYDSKNAIRDRLLLGCFIKDITYLNLDSLCAHVVLNIDQK